MTGEEYVTKESWEAMGVMFGTYISKKEASILDRYAIDQMMTREEAFKSILRKATMAGEPPETTIPQRLQGHRHPYLELMMPRPIYKFLDKTREALGLDWHEIHRIARAYVLDEEGLS